MMNETYDVIIVGCGPAGLSSAIFTGRANLKTLVIGLPEKSQAAIAPHIENYFGFPDGVDGKMLLNKGTIQAQRFGVRFLKDEVVAASRAFVDGKNTFTVKTSKEEEFNAHAMIIATGVPIVLSGIKNERELTGKGVHYCVSCDGPMYRNKRIAVIGNGNHAAESAVEALSYSRDVTIVSNGAAFDFSDDFHREITKWNVKTRLAKVREFKGDNKLAGVLLDDGGALDFDAVFMASGTAGALDFAKNLGLEIQENALVLDTSNMTSLDGVFAAGNCACSCRQIAKNVGDGCNAAISVIRYIRSKEIYLDYGEKSSANESKPGEGSADDVKNVQNPVANSSDTILLQRPGIVPSPPRKLRVGWFSFSCCEDSTIVFTEILNDYYDKITSVMEIAHARVLKKNNNYDNLDIAFVEGAISNDKAAEELRKIRDNSRLLIAVGSCAVTGMPSAQRNHFDARRKKEIEQVVEEFGYRENVVPLHDIVRVDDIIPGCPMVEAQFISVVNRHLKEFGIDAQL
jgi:thioredoxin reductase (NADPH)